MKNRVTAVLWAFFLGGLGAHKFYLGQTGWGVAYLLFFWTFIPGIIAFFEFIILAVMSDADFNAKYNKGVSPSYSGGAVSAKDATSALSDLKKLYDEGVLTAEEYEEKRQKLLRNL